ncbi:MAG: hypothetical protein WDA16_06660 [Candidatus Thermoplasmatota archaeon]
MAGPDIVLFIVGALLLGGATFAIVSQGGPAALGGGSPTGVYDVTYSTSLVEVQKQPVADFGAPQKVSVDVKAMNVTKIIVSVQCSDPASTLPVGAFNLQLQVTPPAGIEAPKSVGAACGQTLKIEVPIASAPPKTSTQGKDARSAEANIPTDANAARAVGSWSISVQGTRAGGTPLPSSGIPGNPGGAIVVQAEKWAAKLSPLTK